MDHDTASKLAEETKRLSQARADFAKLQKDEAEYLKDRESKSQSLLKDINRQIESALNYLKSLNDKSESKQKILFAAFQRFERGLESTLESAENILALSEQTKERMQKVLSELDRRAEHLNKLISRNSSDEKTLRLREKEAEEKLKEAETKLDEAERLAYWHRTGQSYKDKKTK